MYKKNKLKKSKFLLLASIMLIFGYSCNDLVDEFPISEIGPDRFFQNNQDLESAVIGAYDAFQQSYRSYHFLTGEFRSDNFQPANDGRATLDLVDIVNNSTQQENPNLRWDGLYRIVERVNQVIANAPNISDADPSIVAEAYALRSKVYFDLVRTFGDVPLFTEPILLLSDTKKPATNGDEIMTTIVVPDMLRAEELMVNPQADFRFSNSSVLAHQAEVYMWLNENLKAKESIEKLIGLGTHSLVTNEEDWDNLFYNNDPLVFDDGLGKIQEGPELIMSINYTQVEEGGANRSTINTYFFSGVRVFHLSKKIEELWRTKFPVDSTGWVDKYPNTDPVLTREITIIDANGTPKDTIVPAYGDWRYYFSRERRVDGFNAVEIGDAACAKYQQANHDNNREDSDIVIYRYADMLLLLAEAELKLGNANRTLEIINELRVARLLPPVSTMEFGSDQDAQLDFLLEERQLELFAEGKRWWDLRRNNKAIEVLNPILEERRNDTEILFTGTTPLTSNNLIWPIFLEHLIENDLLQPNSAN